MLVTDRPTRPLRPLARPRPRTPTRRLLPASLVRRADPANPTTAIAAGSLTLATIRALESDSAEAWAIVRAIEGERRFFYRIPFATRATNLGSARTLPGVMGNRP